MVLSIIGDKKLRGHAIILSIESRLGQNASRKVSKYGNAF